MLQSKCERILGMEKNRIEEKNENEKRNKCKAIRNIARTAEQQQKE